MTFRIADELREALAVQPETGMGYQLVELSIPARRAEYILVFNATHVAGKRGKARAVREGAEDVSLRRAARAVIAPEPGTRVRAVTLAEARRVGVSVATDYRRGQGPAMDNPLGESSLGERFFRFSAYADDIRILADGAVTRGTYVTTYTDGITAKIGAEAVERYALPNPEPAVHRFWLRPPDPIPVRRGTVQPAFGRKGGGDEVIFEEGAPTGTCHKRDSIPAS